MESPEDKKESWIDEPLVDDRLMLGSSTPTRCEQAPSSWGIGRSEGNVVSEIGQYELWLPIKYRVSI